MECEKCEGHFCLTCISISQSAYIYMSNPAVFWSCQDCTEVIRCMLQDCDRETTESPEPITPVVGLMEKINSMEERIMRMSTMEENLLRIEEAVSSLSIQRSTENGESRLWSQVTANTNSSEEDNTLVKNTYVSPSPDPNMINVFRVAMDKQDEEKKDAENKVKNIILYRAKELKSEDRESRRQHDTQLVEELLNTIEVL